MFSRAFALPVVMIASVVMMMVLVSGLSATTSVNSGLRQQHAARLQKAASEAGIAMATYCIKSNSGSITWTNAKPLKPNTDCNGDELFSCNVATPPATCYVAISGNTKTSFSVGVTVDGSGNASDIDSQGVIINVRGNGGSIQSSNSSSSSSKIAISGQSGSSDSVVAFGQSHVCAIGSNGNTYCWGWNVYGGLGTGTGSNASVPTQIAQGAIPSGVKLKSITAGHFHTCGIGTNSRAYCWGYGTYGQMGNNSTSSPSTPVAVSQGAMPSGVNFKTIAAGSNHTCAIGTDDKAYCWGYDEYGQLGNNTGGQYNTPSAVVQGAMPAGSTIKQIAVEDRNTCAIASDDRAYCWGMGGNGQLGRGSTSNSYSPVAVLQGAMPTGTTFKDITLGTYHACAIGSNDKPYCWGYGASGQTGNNGSSDYTTPVAVAQGAMPSGYTVKKINAGNYGTCAIANDDRIYCWGNAYVGNGTTGNSNYTAIAVSQGAAPVGTTYKNITRGAGSICGVAMTDLLYCWGYNDYGQLGNNSTSTSTTPVATTMSGWTVSNSNSIYVGDNFKEYRY